MTSPSEGRRFAFPVGGAFLVLGAVAWWRGHVPVALALAGLAGLLFVGGLLIPHRLGPVQRAWMRLALVLSKVTTPVFMAVVFFGVITPIGLVMRVLGKDPLARDPRNDSFWVSRPEGPKRRSDLKRQF